MNVIYWKDDRTAEQMDTHTVIIAARDKFMSSWGPAKNAGGSTAAWACKPEDADVIYDWVKSRSEMSYVRHTNIQSLKRADGLVHIYVGKPDIIAKENR